MIKKLAVITNVITISALLHGMENTIQLRNLKRTGTVEQGSQSRRQEMPKDNQDVRLNLQTLSEPLFTDSNGKPSIRSLKQVSHLKTQQDTYRGSTTGRGSSDRQKEKRKAGNSTRTKENSELHQPLQPNNPIRVNIDNQEDDLLDINNNDVKRNHNNIEIENLLETLSHNNSYSEQEMWDLLKKSNPKLHAHAINNQLSINEVMDCPYDFDAINPQIQNLLNQLAKKKSLPLSEMMEYVYLLDNFNIEPEALGQLVQNQHNLSNGPTQLLISKFKGIQKNDPDQYISLALDFITRTCDDGGLKEPSPLHSTHVAIQNETIAEEKKQKIYSIIANVVTIIGFIATCAWAIYGQATGTTNPTDAPTQAPTNAPTNMPTYAPTLPPV